MKDILAMVFVLAVILAPIIALLLVGRFSSRWLARNAPKSRFISKLGLEQALQAVFVLALIVPIPLVRAFEPATAIGKFLNSPFGLVIAAVCALLLSTAFGAGVNLLGRRFKQRQRGGV